MQKFGLRKKFLTVFAVIAIAVAVFLSHNATLAINNGLKDTSNELPSPTKLALSLCRHHVFTMLGLLAIGGLILSEKYIKDESSKKHSQIIIMGIMLVVIGTWFLALSLPGICLCDAWLYWEGHGSAFE